MGSPISGLIAGAVLHRLQSLAFRNHRPKFWARYADDAFVIMGRDQVLTFKEHLNAVFPDIQFTMEEEENKQLAFLDVLIGRKDCGGINTKVLRHDIKRLESFVRSGAAADKANTSKKPEDSSEREWPNKLQRCEELTPALKLRLIRRDPATYEAEIIARGDNRVSRELPESWFTGPQSFLFHTPC
ncbi:hypothetical protein SprV_0100098600 [Sparganum proliferum]